MKRVLRMPDHLDVLRESVRHLADVASRIVPEQYTAPAYPSEWSIADTFSHLGSGAVIGRQNFENAIFRRENDSSFNATVWDLWNAKTPTAQVADCLASDREYLSALEQSTSQQRAEFEFNLGPYTFDFDGLVGLRLSEHVLHTWDIEVAVEPTTTLAIDAADAVLDNISFIVSMTGKATGQKKRINIQTIDPERHFSLDLDNSAITWSEGDLDGDVNLTLPAEALVRLIYGRLDVEHSSNLEANATIDELRLVFQGF